ncbi:hypothetical protein MSAN_01820600 [Mycena sanguinolenta]|uniref:Uncharacterized protein n=1 Tax=Mycena sanguinolenta TaxID=230812 RepID=A0A8H6XRQ1_9AGAR|nr:hypothetical protein MSAN_01820600 [Mycena sanguinolenta]
MRQADGPVPADNQDRKRRDNQGEKRETDSTQVDDQTWKRQTPIELCGIMDSSAVFESTFNCTQGPTNLPKFSDCLDIDDAITDSLIRPMEVVLPPRSGLVVSLINNTCAFVFLNDDAEDTYQTCLHAIPDMAADMSESVCPNIEDGFIGSVRSLVQPGVQNWEVHIASSSSLGL